MIKRYLPHVVVSAILWLAMATGYGARAGIGSWLADVHSGSLVDQVREIAYAGVRVGVSFVTFAVTFSVVVLTAFLVVAILQEAYYQLHRRRVLSLWGKKRAKSDIDDIDADDEVDIGAPKRPVRATKHARKTGAGKSKRNKPVRSVLSRVQQLQGVGTANAIAESYDDDELRVEHDDES